MATVTDLTNKRIADSYVQLLHTGEDGGLTSSPLQIYDGDGTGSALKLATTSINIADSHVLKLGTGNDLTLYHDGSNSYITNSTGALKLATETSGIAITIGHTTSETTVADNLTVTGNAAVGGNLTVTGTTTFNGGTITMGDANTDNVVFGAEVDSNIIPDDDDTYDLGSSSKQWQDIYIDGTAYLDAIDFNGTAISSTAAELNIVDGDTSASSTTLADADRVVVNDAGTMKQVALTDFETYFESVLDTLSSVTTVGTLNSGAISSGFGAIDIGSSALSTTGSVTLGATTFGDNNITNVGSISLDTIQADDTNLDISLTDNSSTALEIKESSTAYLTFVTTNSGEKITLGKKLEAGSVEIEGSAFDVNGGTVDAITSLTVGTDGSGADVYFYSATSGDHLFWDASEELLTITGTNGQTALNVADGNLVVADNIDLEGDIDVNGTSNLDNTDVDGTLVVDGSNISLDSTSTLNIDNSNTSNGITIGTATSGVPISVGHSVSETTVNDNLTVTGNATVSGNLLVVGDSSEVKADNLVVDNPTIAMGLTNGSAPSADSGFDLGLKPHWHTGSTAKTAFLGVDVSTSASAPKLTYIPDASFSSEVVSGSVGSIVANLEGDVTGDLTGNVTGNASGTAATVTGAAQTNITSLGTLTTLTVDNVIINATTIGHTDDTDLMTLADGVLTVAGEIDGASLDIEGDADINGTLEADAYTVNGTALDEFIADTVGAMVGSNTESGIAVAYQDADNTLDFTVGTLNQDTTGTAAIATTVTITDNESTDEDNAVIFAAGGDVDGGNLGLESDGNLTYNPSSGLLTATAFSGNITGNVTGNTSGTAATVTTAAQSNITSLGTLTALTVDDVAIDGKVITMTGSSSDTAIFTAGTNGTLSIVTTDAAAAAANIQITADGTVDIDSAGVLTLDSGAAINIEPASGSAILLDGTVSVDAGVITGATSITSTALEIGDASDTTLTRSAAGVLAVEGTILKKAGKETIWIPSIAMTPTESNGCADIALIETTSGRPDMYVLDFDKDSDEHAQFSVAFPKSWNLGTVTFQAFWSGIAATTGVSWGLQGVAFGDNDSIDTAYGSAIVVDDSAQGAVEELLVSAESGAVTIAGSPADDQLCYFRIFRDVDDANDDMNGDARLHGIKLFFTTDIANDD